MAQAIKTEKLAAKLLSRECQCRIETINIAERDEVNSRMSEFVLDKPEIRSQALT